ncbi:hypothetical protein INT46_006575 [Mucor plumbeus]|uniref:Uncharacterized protein n=1 Tax=Mucor plumbeus TaxID=97098 RepID=A0A8H7RHH6_9FUNG|nr:hypothetical protein INT46_006575 [Mucor plumbeus]
MDEDGHEPVQIEVDEEAYPLDNITNFTTHSKLKPPEKPMKMKAAKVEAITLVDLCEDRSNQKYGDDVKVFFFLQIYEKGLTERKAAKIMNAPSKTAYNWYNKDQLEIRKYLKQTFGDSSSTKLNQALKGLTSQFEDLKVS